MAIRGARLEEWPREPKRFSAACWVKRDVPSFRSMAAVRSAMLRPVRGWRPQREGFRFRLQLIEMAVFEGLSGDSCTEFLHRIDGQIYRWRRCRMRLAS